MREGAERKRGQSTVTQGEKKAEMPKQEIPEMQREELGGWGAALGDTGA